MGTITSLLREIRNGQCGAVDRLFSHVYEDLKDVARQYLSQYRSRNLPATALVSAAYERLASKEAIDAADRRHLFYLFSRAMHDILVEEVRADLAIKRGGRLRRAPLLEIAVDGTTHHADILDVQEALSALSATDPDAARIVMLRYYGGLSVEEAAEAMQTTFAIARRQWEYAKAWLHERLSSSEPRENS